MTTERKMLPVGLENFEEIIKGGFYYVDKTGMIAELLQNTAKVNLFTRPRRFGKSLNMSMLKSFFEIGRDASLFDGLAISKESGLCEKYMGKHPVVNLSLKDMEGDNFQSACRLAAIKISAEASRFEFLRTSPAIADEDRELYVSLLKRDMSVETLRSALWDLCRLLEKHYGQKAILLIDEYDVPLQKAFYRGYYDEMAGLIRGMFSQALKTNESLQFAVLTGCLRISKESIFTGMNNMKVFTIADMKYGGYFGFTDKEVKSMLGHYGLEDAYDRIRQWYDGYRFGQTDVYCPWDVINYCFDIRSDKNLRPQNYWANSSGNDVVREFVERLDMDVTAGEMEELIAGEVIMKEIRQELTYREMYDSPENIWSLLYMTGYLTTRGEAEGRMMSLTIPNMEIRDIFKTQIMDVFRKNVRQDVTMVREFCGALKAGDAVKAEGLLRNYLSMTVGIRDTFVKRELKENFYHGILLGILGCKGDWYVTSNYETGDGYGDIMAIPKSGSPGIIIEVKYAHGGNLQKGAQDALRQIEERRYDAELRKRDVTQVLKYGIACYKKDCRVVLGE